MSTPSPNKKLTSPEQDQDENKTIFHKLPTRSLLAIVTFLFIVGWLINTPPGLSGKADAVGYAICHQIVERSFTVNGKPIALCARCTGMYLGAMLAIGYQLFLGKRRAEWPGKGILVILGLFFLGFAIDGSNSAARLFLGHDLLYTPSNTYRLITGTGMGVAMGVMILPTFNQTVWKAYDHRSYFLNWKQFAGMIAAGVVMILLVLAEIPVVLLAFSYISAAGVVLILVMLYTMILMVIFDKENVVTEPNQLVPWLLGGILIAFIHIAGIDFVRYILTGTWDGMHIDL